MGQIAFGGAMSHVLDPEYYQAACGDLGRQKVTEAMEAIARMGDRLVERKPDALIVVADDHMNAFSFNCVPAFCVRIGKTVQRMMQDNAEAFDKVLEHMATEYMLHEELANHVLEQGMASGFDLALSWEAPIDHAFLSPVNTLLGSRPIPPLVPIFVNAFIAPQRGGRPSSNVAHPPAGGGAKARGGGAFSGRGVLPHSPELLVGGVGKPDRLSAGKLIYGRGGGEHEPLLDLTADELHKTG